jgi:hypothetical protein
MGAEKVTRTVEAPMRITGGEGIFSLCVFVIVHIVVV